MGFDIYSQGPGALPNKLDIGSSEKHDTNDLSQIVASIYCGGGGAVKAVGAAQATADAVTYTVQAGAYILGPFRQVFDTGTTATGLIGDYI